MDVPYTTMSSAYALTWLPVCLSAWSSPFMNRLKRNGDSTPP